MDLMKKVLRFGLNAAMLGGMVLGLSAADELAPLPIQLPKPAFKGTPGNPPPESTVEKPSDKPRPPYYAPKGCKNLALGKKVTCSDKAPETGTPDLVTDGNKEAGEQNVLRMRRGMQYVQIDLEKPAAIYAILVWHAHDSPSMIMRDVVVQVADDPDFIENVRTLYNNDQDNSSGLGIGTDREYYETREGKLIDAKGVKARYVRLYSKGYFEGENRVGYNPYTEVEVWGIPAD